MNLNKLLKVSDYFLKLARLKYDQLTYETMEKSVDHCIAVRQLKDLREKVIEVKDEDELEKLISKCHQILTSSYQRYSLKIANSNGFYWSKNTVPTWKPITHLIVFFNEAGKREKNINEDAEESRAAGMFISNDNGGIVYMDLSDEKRRARCSTLRGLESFLSEIHSTLQHELRHKMQMDYKKDNQLKDWGGVPGKKYRHQDPNVDIHGVIGDTDEKVEHMLRDTEFYPNLMSAADNFCHIYGNANKDELKELLKIRVCADLDVNSINYSIEEYGENYKKFERVVGEWIIYPSVLFYAWKKYGGESKWRKGVVEFIKAVESRLNTNQQ